MQYKNKNKNKHKNKNKMTNAATQDCQYRAITHTARILQ